MNTFPVQRMFGRRTRPKLNTICSNNGQTLDTSAKHLIPQAKNIPYWSTFVDLTHTQLTTAEELLRPQTAAVETIKEQTQSRREKHVFYYNQHANELSPLFRKVKLWE